MERIEILNTANEQLENAEYRESQHILTDGQKGSSGTVTDRVLLHYLVEMNRKTHKGMTFFDEATPLDSSITDACEITISSLTDIAVL